LAAAVSGGFFRPCVVLKSGAGLDKREKIATRPTPAAGAKTRKPVIVFQEVGEGIDASRLHGSSIMQ
jgi:hypothetical protein